MNPHALRLTQRLGYRWSSDCRGTHPFMPVWNGEVVHCPQLPTTLPTIDELVGIDDITAEARRRKVSATEIVRERLSGKASPETSEQPWKDSLARIIGAVDEFPHGGDSRNIKAALKASGYGRNRSR